MQASRYAYVYVFMRVCLGGYMYVRMHVCMYGCVHAWMSACLYASIFLFTLYTFVHIGMCVYNGNS